MLEGGARPAPVTHCARNGERDFEHAPHCLPPLLTSHAPAPKMGHPEPATLPHPPPCMAAGLDRGLQASDLSDLRVIGRGKYVFLFCY